MLLWAALALAAPPDGSPHEFTVGSSTVIRLETSGDGRLTAAIEADVLHLLDMDDWSTRTTAPCTVSGVALEWFDLDAHYLWIGCTDGLVRLQYWDDGELTTVMNGSDPATYDVEDPIVGLWYWAEGGLVYVLTEGDSNVLALHTIEVDGGAIDGSSAFPVGLARTGIEDGVITDTYLLVFHGGDDVTYLPLGGTAPLPNLTPFAFSVSDAAPSIRDTAYVAVATGIAEFIPASSLYGTVTTSPTDASAVGASLAPSDEWLLGATGDSVSVWSLDDGTPESQTPDTTFSIDDTLVDIVVARWGYAFAGTNDGGLRVLTANPWVSDLAATPASAGDGDTVTLDFTVDSTGEFEVLLGGDAGGDGEVVGSGTVDTAGPVQVDVVVDDAWSEGTNRVYVLFEDDDGLVGHDATTVSVDNPPGQVNLSDANVRFGDRSLTVSFAGLTDEDLDHYTVYITKASFDPGDWDTGGPEFDGEDEIDAPIEVSATVGEDPSIRISPLTNGDTYYIAVRATDAGGKEGPMSDVAQGTPQPTYSASELAGEEGGFAACGGCATGGSGGWLALGGAVLAFGLRRRRWAALGVLALAPVAHAQDDDGPSRDVTPAWGNVEIRYGMLQFQEGTDSDPNAITEVYGRSGDILYLEVGPQVGRVFEVDLGVGLYQKVARTTSAGGDSSGEIAMLTLWPLYANVNGRLHIVDEQFAVPFAQVGVDYVLWSEEREVLDTRDKTRGGKAGWHYAFGVDLLLDTFAPGRASLLEAQTGINDTYLVFEWRHQAVDPGQFLWWENSDGLTFTGNLFTVGLKLDF